MVDKKARLRISITNGLKSFVFMVLICYGLMFAIKQSPAVKPLYDEIQSYNKQSGVHLQILPNGLDLMGLSLQIPFAFESTSSTKFPISIVLEQHMLILLLLPLVSVLAAGKNSFKDEQPTAQHIMEYIETAVVFTVLSQAALAMNTKHIYFDELQRFGIRLEGAFCRTTGVLLTFMIIMMAQIFWSRLLKKEGRRAGHNGAVLGEVFIGLGVYLKFMALFAFMLTVAFMIWFFATFDVKWRIGGVLLAGLLALPNLVATTWGLLLGGELQSTLIGGGIIKLSLADRLGLFAIPVGLVVIGITVKAFSTFSKPKLGLKIGISCAGVALVNLVIIKAAAVRIQVQSDLSILKLIPFFNENHVHYLYMAPMRVLGIGVLAAGCAGVSVIVSRKLSIKK